MFHVKRRLRTSGRWNHNIHCYPVVFDALAGGVESALDVGCGEGLLCRELAARGVPRVVGIDRDAAGIELARCAAGGAEYRCADFRTASLPAGSFDLISSVAMLHHVDPEPVLHRMAELLRPGGRLVVIGVADRWRPVDLVWEAAGVVCHRFGGPVWHHPSPTVWPPAHVVRQLHRIAERAVPGVRYRRRMLWRYTLEWTKPRRP